MKFRIYYFNILNKHETVVVEAEDADIARRDFYNANRGKAFIVKVKAVCSKE